MSLTIKSPWITMDTKGANTFPLYNVPPEPKIFKIRSFLCFSNLSLLDKRKFGGDSCYPQQWFQIKNLKSVHRITELATLLGTL